MPKQHIAYGNLPSAVTDNLTPEQWHEVQPMVIHEHQRVPETTSYINLKNGQISLYAEGQRANAPLLAEHNLAGGRGMDSTQFHTSPPDAHGVP